jgi:DNA mismatch repair protein MutS
MSLIKDYLDKTKKYVEEFGEFTIMLIQNGAFFEVYGLKDDNDEIHGCKLSEFSKICDLNIVDKKAAGDKNVLINGLKVVNAGFKDHLLDKYVKKLQDNGYTVVVYEQDEQCQNTTRSLTGIYSPGTYFSNEPDKITNKTCCIWIELVKTAFKKQNETKVYVGASVIDVYTGTTSITEFSEIYIKTPTTFDELERFISIHNPSETIILSSLTRLEIDEIISYTGIRSKLIHFVSLTNSNETKSKNYLRAMNCEKQTFQLQLLNKFYKINDVNVFMEPFIEHVFATQSFCYLLDFIYQHNPNLVCKVAEPVFENSSKKLILANHSLKQLNIIDDENYQGKYSSVVKMLNECVTSMGKRKFSYNFLNPITDELLLQQEYNIIDTLLPNVNSIEFAGVRNTLSCIKDISKINRQIMLQKVTPKQVYQLYKGILYGKQIYDQVIQNDLLKEYLIEKIEELNELPNCIKKVNGYIENVFIIEDCKDIDYLQKVENSFIKTGTDEKLDKMIETLMNSQDQLECIRAYFSSLIANYEIENSKLKTKKKKVITNNSENDNNDEDIQVSSNNYVKIHETEKNNFSLLATERRCKLLEEVIKNKKITSVNLKYTSSYTKEETEFILSFSGDCLEFHKQSASNKSITNIQITQLCRNVSSIKINLIEMIVKVYNSIVCKLQEYNEEVEKICEFITYIDLVYTKVHIANKYCYCKPEIIQTENNKSCVNVTGLRHCLIEKIQQSELYVANDICLGYNDDNNKMDGVLLYGTNAVGKTSFIRALGISVVMAQAGLYVPATTYCYKPYKYIFTRILGNDNIFKGLSTFAVEMLELRTILRLADKNSLVLGDELCSGTESISAISIFVSGIQLLSRVGCSFIFATHLHEIINYDEIKELKSVSLKHMSVVYDKEKDCLVYDRKLKDGPGTNMYGLEVCKSLNLPQEFLENANNIRMKYNPESASILEQKQSKYNAKCIKGMCDNCGDQMATEVHHLLYQEDANSNGTIVSSNEGLLFHKNNNANLINICEKCHTSIHKSGKKYKKVKTTKGTSLKEI